MPESGALKRDLDSSLERRKCRIQPGVKKGVQSCPVISSENGIALGLCHATHFLHCQFRLIKPGNDSNCDHQVECPIIEVQRINTTHVQREQVGDSSLYRMPACLLDHRLNRIDGVNAEPALGEGNRQETGTAANLQYPGGRCESEAVDPMKHRYMTIAVNLGVYATAGIDILPVRRPGLEIGIDFFLLLRAQELFHVKYSPSCCLEQFAVL